MQYLTLALCSAMVALGTLSPVWAQNTPNHNRPKPVNVDRENRSQFSAKKAYRVIYTPVPDPIPLNKHFTLKLVVQDANNRPIDNAKIVVDAGMPEHNHGMNVKPVVKALGKGLFEVKGLLFHMGGYWEIYVDVQAPGKPKERATFGLTLKLEDQRQPAMDHSHHH
jgi:hypothetical protein